MKKAKTNKFSIFLSALLCAVFAFTVGITYAGSSMVFNYGTNPASASAYLANQQYVVVNDTLTAPVVYSVGSHATEIALEYAIDYDFDLRIKYALKWSDQTLATTNVELLFANRDNVIVDETYIYYINYKNNAPAGISAGEGKLSLIAGVEIIETDNDNYLGKTLTVEIQEVKIAKTGDSYITSPLKDSGQAGKAWLAHKSSTIVSSAHIMVYNYRYKKEVGVKAPGHNSAYSKKSSNSVITGQWIGGNRAYAGVGVYIITGNSPVQIESFVSGTWRQTETGADEDVGQFDNNIRFNYSDDWQLKNYDSNYLFEYRTYKKLIPAYTACYLPLVDNIEITCAGNVGITNYDRYRLVVDKIYINNVQIVYDTETDATKITNGTISGTTASDGATYYAKNNITLVSANKYLNNLYECSMGDASPQSYHNTTFVLINNTNKKLQVNISYNLNYFISNGKTGLTYTVTDDNNVSTKYRATQFTDDAYYRDMKTLESSNSNFTASGTTFVLDPYASVNFGASYEVFASFNSIISAAYGSVDAWVELDPITAVSETVSTGTGLAVEVFASGTNGVVRVKNNSREVVTSISANVLLYNYSILVWENPDSSKPADWDATFWRYGWYDNSVFVKNESKTFANNLQYHRYEYVSTSLTLTTKTGVTYNSTTGACSVSGLNLKPNESVEILTFTVPTDGKLLIQTSARATASSSANSLMLVNSGVNQNYIVNYSTGSYIVRFNGVIPTGETFEDVESVGGYNYYIYVVRPGQIIETASTATEINSVSIGSVFSKTALSNAGWNSTIITYFENCFS